MLPWSWGARATDRCRLERRRSSKNCYYSPLVKFFFSGFRQLLVLSRPFLGVFLELLWRPFWQVKKLIEFRCLKWRKIKLGPFWVLGIFFSLSNDANSTIVIKLVAVVQENERRRDRFELYCLLGQVLTMTCAPW